MIARLFVLVAMLFAAPSAMAAEYLNPALGRGFLDRYGEGYINADPQGTYLVGQFINYREWFSFSNLATDITSASLHVYVKNSPDYSSTGSILSLYLSPGFFGDPSSFVDRVTNYNNLTSGPLIAQFVVPDFTVGDYWDIPLNATGINLLNSTNNILIGGELTGKGQLVGGLPPTSLAITTLNSASPGVPEPATWAMMLFGFGGIGYAMRRKTLKLAAI